MEPRQNGFSALADLRVLDLAGPAGVYCTKLLAELGADVIKIEPPGGDPMRWIGPFYLGEPDPEKSLYWWQFNTNKRSITLNLETDDGRTIFRRLLRTADVLVETFPPGDLEQKGIGYKALTETNPRLILTSITPFGQTGPYRDFRGSDLIACALGGLLNAGGLPDEPPRRPGASQAYHIASGQAAVATMLAVYDRDRTGRGQWIDVSQQDAVAAGLYLAPQYYHLRGEICTRNGGVALPQSVSAGRTAGVGYLPCRDGWVDCYALGGDRLDRLVRWMYEEGEAGDLMTDEWQEFFRLQGDAAERRRVIDDPEYAASLQGRAAVVAARIAAFMAKRTKREIFAGGQERGILIVPVNNTEDLVLDQHLNDRGYFTEIDHCDLGRSIRYPGPPYHLSETPAGIVSAAPHVGQHNEEIYIMELGLTATELASFAASGVV